jgi:hypothetical protein
MLVRKSARSWFLAGSLIIFLDIGQFVVIVLRRWDALSGQVLYLLSAGLVGLLVFWYFALMSQRQMSQLVRTTEPQTVPVMSPALIIGMNVAIRGLLVFGLSMSFLLRAVFILSRA